MIFRKGRCFTTFILIINSLSFYTASTMLCSPNQIKDENVCKESGYLWESVKCTYNQTNDIIQVRKYHCYNYLTISNCISDLNCAWYNNACENFVGCSVYENFSGIADSCKWISNKCISTGKTVCGDKPSGCSLISKENCGKIETITGSQESCFWNEKKLLCMFKGCSQAKLLPSQGFLAECQKFNNNCKFDGLSCVDQLQNCESYTVEKCNKIKALSGNCKVDNDQCIKVDCYQYFGNSMQDCNQYYGRNGQQCIHNLAFNNICLEPAYHEDIGICFEQVKDKTCDSGYLSISSCFKIQYKQYDNTISFCYLQDQNMEKIKVDCSLLKNQQDCNRAETPQERKCQWDDSNQKCQTIYYSTQLVGIYNDQQCKDFDENWRLVVGESKTFCIQKMSCEQYYEQYCHPNKDEISTINQLSEYCVWRDGKCRASVCSDFIETTKCQQFNQCKFESDKCLGLNQTICDLYLKELQCFSQGCVWVTIDNICQEVNPYNIHNIEATSLEECQQYSQHLVYFGRNCVLKTSCENYSLSQCNGNIQYDDYVCTEVNSKCVVVTRCDQIHKKTVKDCQQFKPACSTNGTTCIEMFEECASYGSEQTCKIQKDGSLCQWEDQCRLMQCEDLKQDCDSINLCLDKTTCRQNQCIQNTFYSNSYCISIKSKCNSYISQEQCKKSVQGYCYWNGMQCETLSNCSLIQKEDICNSGYLKNICIYITAQCVNVTCNNTSTSFMKSLNDEYINCNGIIDAEACKALNGLPYKNNTQCYFCTNYQVSSYCELETKRPLKLLKPHS